MARVLDGTSGIQTPNTVSISTDTNPYQLPIGDGQNGQAIVTDGQGNLSFGTVASEGALNPFLLAGM